MGIWNIDSDGNSFVENDALWWGDSPANAMDEALKDIIVAFRLDVGRAPTLEELHAGLACSAEQALKEDQDLREAEGLYTFAIISEWSLPDLDGTMRTSEDCSYIDAKSAEDARKLWDKAEEGRQEWIRNLPDDASEIMKNIGKTEIRVLSVEQVEPNRVKLEIVK